MRYVTPAWLNRLSVRVLLADVAGVVLTVTLLLSISVAIVAVKGDVLSGPAVADLTQDLAGMLQFDAEGIPVGFSDALGFLETEDDFAPWLFDSLRHETAYRVLDASGNVVLASQAGEAFWHTSGAARRLERGRFEFEREGVVMRAATESIENNGRTWFLQCAVSERLLQFSYDALLPFTAAGVAVFSLVLLVVFAICGYVTLGYALKPIQDISETAASISPHSLEARLDIDTVPTEIVPLVKSFNRVLERVEQGYRIQQDFLGTAAHELKTPLALIRAQVELASDSEYRRSLLNDVEHMTRQVQQLLLLAEASERQNYTFAAVDILAVATEAAGYLRRVADAAGVVVVAPDDAAGPQWSADRGALFTLFKNLLENAIQHAPRGTRVQVEVSASTVSVRDWGPGVNREVLPKLFSRFWRGTDRRDHGAGLGLAICQEIARAHGWTLSAHQEEPGLRLSVSIATGEPK
jgi:signal transduction histidine kinase